MNSRQNSVRGAALVPRCVSQAVYSLFHSSARSPDPYLKKRPSSELRTIVRQMEFLSDVLSPLQRERLQSLKSEIRRRQFRL